MTALQSIDLTPAQFKEVKSLLARYLPNTRVWAYGSRVRWSARPDSDLDMVAFATPDQISQVSLLREAFEESNLPFPVDLFVWDTVPEKFRVNIQQQYMEIQSGEKEKGVVGSEWPIVKLEDVAEVIDSRHQTPVYSDAGFPMVRVVDVKGGFLTLLETKKVSEAIYKDFSKGRDPQIGDLVFSRVGSYGNVSYVATNERFCLGQNTALIVPKDKSRFLYYQLISPQVKAQIEEQVVGAVQKTISLKSIRNLELSQPSEFEKNQISSFLASLDNKITLNRQLNQTLENMAQALFKSWFVDFDPVIDNALAAGNPIPEPFLIRAQARQDHAARCQQQSALATPQQTNPHPQPATPTAGLPEELRELFPCEFELTESLGWVPKGWADTSIASAISVNPRVSLPKGKIAKFADMKALPTSGFGITEVIEKEFSGGAKFQQNDVLLARITPCLENGKTGLVDFLSEDEAGFGSTEFIVLREKGQIKYPFIACLSRDDNFRKHCMQSMVGSSGRQRVQNACFDSYFIAIPKRNEILDLFTKITLPNFVKMTSCKNEIESLTKLRDTLLPKLISGELRIPEAQAQLEEALG